MVETRDERCGKRFAEVVKAVREANKAELNVANAMIATVCKVRLGKVEAAEGWKEYAGVPADFDCEAFLRAYEG